MGALEWTYLGPVDYDRSLELQDLQAARVAAGKPAKLLLLEHPPTITLGRHADKAHLRLSEEELQRRGISIHRIKRGGDVTVHGPGQLVGYPIADLRRLGLSVPDWVQGNARVLCEVLGDWGLAAVWSDLHPGVWVNGAKIAALGFRIVHGISTHGFALNVDCDLAAFETIIPCGLPDLPVTSMQELGIVDCSPSDLVEKIAEAFARVFGFEAATQSAGTGREGEERALASSC